MRLIDADALPNELFKKHVHDGEELEPMLYFEDTVKVVENAPTVAAIPVEWLEEHDSEGNEYGRRYITVAEALSMWRKEQEAR